ncbi:MAG: glycine cleavage system protein H [Candidatus Zixiibacteriota bacterium]
MERRLSRKNGISPEEELNRCVWMTAGVISYKLCPFRYDCEQCEFDRVMRAQILPGGPKSKVKMYVPKDGLKRESLYPSDLESEAPFFTFSLGEIDQKLHIHPSHLWARQENNHTWKIGVDKLLAYILPPPMKFELSKPDQEITQEETWGRLLTDVGAVSVAAPLSGRLVQTNPELDRYPELIQEDPWGEGWLAEIDWCQDKSELEKLYVGSSAAQFLKEEARHLRVLLKYRGVRVGPVGETLPDGGTDVKYLHQILVPQWCLNLSRKLVVSGEGSA